MPALFLYVFKCSDVRLAPAFLEPTEFTTTLVHTSPALNIRMYTTLEKMVEEFIVHFKICYQAGTIQSDEEKMIKNK
jgi:hypothetical protein